MEPFKKGGFIRAIKSKLHVVHLTIIGARSVLSKKSLKLHKGDTQFIINDPIIRVDLYEGDNNKILTQYPNELI